MIDTNRRGFIAASAATATAVAIPASAAAAAPAADRSAWDAAMARYRAAEREHDAYAANIFDPAWEAEQAFEKAHGLRHKQADGLWNRSYFERRKAFQEKHGTDYCVPDHLHERMEALSDGLCDARGDLLDVPAPDLAALRFKLDDILAVERRHQADGGSTASYGYGYVKQTLADIARLLPAAD